MEHLVCATHFMSMQQGVACLSQVSGVKQLLVETLAAVSLKQVPPPPWPQFPPLLNGYDADSYLPWSQRMRRDKAGNIFSRKPSTYVHQNIIDKYMIFSQEHREYKKQWRDGEKSRNLYFRPLVQ